MSPIRLLLLALVAWGLISLWECRPKPAAADVQYERARAVTVTWYLPTGSAMYNGEAPHIGAAACSWDLPLGTVALFPDGRVTVCKDRGRLGSAGWIDVYVPDRHAGAEVAAAYHPGRVTVSLFRP